MLLEISVSAMSWWASGYIMYVFYVNVYLHTYIFAIFCTYSNFTSAGRNTFLIYVNFFSVVFHKPNFYKYVFTIIKVIYLPYKKVLSSQKTAKKRKLPNPYPTEIFVTSWFRSFHKCIHLHMIMYMEPYIYKYSV